MTKGTARVTVVIAAYNAAEFLGRCLDSLGNQTFRDFEVVVVDDGSTDATSLIAEQSAGVQVIRQSNSGPGAARARACRNRDSEFLAFIDADDAWMPDRLSRLVAAADSDQQLAFFTSDAIVVDPFGNELGRYYSGQLQFPPPQRQLEAIVEHNFVFTSCLVRRSAFETAGGFSTDREIIGAEDYDLWLRLIAGDNFGGCIKEALCWYHHRPASLSRQDPLSNEKARLLVLARRLPEFWALGINGTVRDNLFLAIHFYGFRHPFRALRHLRAASRSGGSFVSVLACALRSLSSSLKESTKPFRKMRLPR
jgi:glycosyltransferase involved in cell wall biosynthesis